MLRIGSLWRAKKDNKKLVGLVNTSHVSLTLPPTGGRLLVMPERVAEGKQDTWGVYISYEPDVNRGGENGEDGDLPF